MGLPLTSPTQLTWYQNAKKSCAPCRNRIKFKVLEVPQSQKVFSLAQISKTNVAKSLSWAMSIFSLKVALTLFLPGEGGISPYMNVTWPLRLGIGLKLKMIEIIKSDFLSWTFYQITKLLSHNLLPCKMCITWILHQLRRLVVETFLIYSNTESPRLHAFRD